MDLPFLGLAFKPGCKVCRQNAGDFHAVADTIVGMNTTKIRACFAITLLIGLGCFLCALMVDDFGPYVMLDAVLTPDELADEQIRNRMLAILNKAKGFTAPYWFITGAVIVAVSIIGLRETSVGNQVSTSLGTQR